MQVIKRDGRHEAVHFEKITNRLRKLCNVNPAISAADVSRVAQHACAAVHDNIRTETLDQITADAAVALATEHPDYSALAARILVSNLQKTTHESVRDVYSKLRHVVSDAFWDVVNDHADAIDSFVDFTRDYQFDYFGLRTLTKAYLQEGERPQHMYIRVAIGIWGSDLVKVKETYDALSTHQFTHASPTLFNAGTKTPQLASCFLMGVHDDSLDCIFESFHKAATISKYGGGIGFHVHSIRAKGSLIKSTNGTSDGLVPMLKVANEVFRYVNQSGKRKGSCAIYIEPHHADILQVLDLKRNQGDEHLRARDLFYSLFISDLFMERVENDAEWSLFDPGTAPGLEDVYGTDYNILYHKYESEGRAVKKVRAHDIWFAILRLQIETGVPYMLYKDSVNSKTNQSNLGVIKSSNLCVAPETRVLTKDGHCRIDELCGQNIEVWNGEEWSDVVVRQTNANTELVRVTLSNGMSLDCTPYHKFYVKASYHSTKPVKKTASELDAGDSLIKWTAPVLSFNDAPRFPYAYTHGFFCGDGTYHKTYAGDKTVPSVALYGEKKLLIKYLDVRSASGKEDAIGRLNVLLPKDMPIKFVVPDTAPLEDRLAWLAGLIDADGHKQSHTDQPNTFSVYIASTEYAFLCSVQAMLLTMGVHSKVAMMRDEGMRSLPDGHGGHADFFCQTTYRLGISSVGVSTLLDLGLRPYRVTLDSFERASKSCDRYVRVDKVEYLGRHDATYCFNEPKRHMGVFNGILTGNCAEICQFTAPDEIAVCNLGSMSLPAFVIGTGAGAIYDYTALHASVKVLARNLDRVIDVNFYPLPEAERSNFRHRPIGTSGDSLVFFHAFSHAFFSQALACKGSRTSSSASRCPSIRRKRRRSTKRYLRRFITRQSRRPAILPMSTARTRRSKEARPRAASCNSISGMPRRTRCTTTGIS